MQLSPLLKFPLYLAEPEQLTEVPFLDTHCNYTFSESIIIIVSLYMHAVSSLDTCIESLHINISYTATFWVQDILSFSSSPSSKCLYEWSPGHLFHPRHTSEFKKECELGIIGRSDSYPWLESLFKDLNSKIFWWTSNKLGVIIL
jgi:hypothetical protein